MTKTVNIPCRCGCGEIITEVGDTTFWRIGKGQSAGYIRGHQCRGEASPSWKGGRRIVRGYVEVRYPDHPNANTSGYIREHRLVMSESLGRPLEANERIHHKNRDRLDNRIENLELTTPEEHVGLHPRPRREYEPKICLTCGKAFLPVCCSEPTYRGAKYCSRTCSGLAHKGERAPSAKLSNAQVSEIRALGGKMSVAEIAEKFGIGTNHIGRILNNQERIWDHITAEIVVVDNPEAITA